MPYIPEEERKVLDWKIRILVSDCSTLGQLTYVVYKLVRDWSRKKGSSYAGYAKVLGMLRCVELEFYSREVAEYEEQKRKENGDV